MSISKRALITGITGQDGSYLAEFLLNKGYSLLGLLRRTSGDSLARIPDASKRKIKFLYGNLRDEASIRRALEESRPNEIYNLAAQSDVGVSFKCPEETMDINYYGVGRLVDEAVRVNPDVKIYQASTSEMFGCTNPPQNEDSSFDPVSPYGISKLRAYKDYVVRYRNERGLFICAGFLFNHESPRRGVNFVTRKITKSLAEIKLGFKDCLELGNLEARRDWGFAGDYVTAMWMMLQQNKPEDYVIATGEAHSVRDFVETAAKELDMKIAWEGAGLNEVGRDTDGKIIVRISAEFYRPTEVNSLKGDYSKAIDRLGWRPKVTFAELVKMMARADLDGLSSRV